MRYRNYRLFFAGQAVSQTGSWMQRIALGWFVLQLTHSPFAVGLMAVAQFLPFTLLGLFGGVLVDRLDARRTVIGTQVAQLATAIALACIALAHIAQPWMLYTIAFLNGLVLVLDVPSRQQLTYRMVGRDELPNAIALNSSLFNASRIFGPAAAGIVYGFAGAGICFLVNAASFFAVLVSLLALRTREFFALEDFERPAILRGTLEGLAYVRRQPRMMLVVGLTLVIATFSFNFNVTLPVLAYSTLHSTAAVYGLLSALFGAGALVGALTAASLGRASAKVMIAGSLVFTGAELLLAPVHSPILAGALLFLTGAGFTAWSANANASMQLAAPDRLRGRIIAIYFYAFNGTGPAAGLLAGWLCARGGTQLAFVVAGVVGLAGTAAAAVWLRRGVPQLPRGRRVAVGHEQRATV
ncbi:MAG TPA: MFS transporter [Gaiellaceae bacterium]|nr:MFS transporter [Gaiellaceae bacterium]